MSWFSDTFDSIGHSISNVWHDVTGGLSDAEQSVAGFIDKTPLRGAFAPVNFASDVIKGKNVFDSFGQRAFQAAALPLAAPAFLDDKLSQTSFGKKVTAIQDSLSGGFASRTHEITHAVNNENFGGTLTKDNAEVVAKDTAINAAELGAIVLTAGAAADVGEAAGLSETASTGAGVFAGFKVGSGVGSNLASNNILGAIGAASGIVDAGFGIDGAGDLISSLGGGSGGGGSAPSRPAPHPVSTAPTEPFSGIASGSIPANYSALAFAAAAYFILYSIKGASA